MVLGMVPADAVITYVPDDGTTADIVRVSQDSNGIWRVAYTGIGTGVLLVTVDGVTMEPGHQTGRVLCIKDNGAVTLAQQYSVSSSYAKVTLDPASSKLEGAYIEFLHTGSSNESIQFFNGDAPQLGTPTALKWNVAYNWTNTESTRMGSLGFVRADPDQSHYEVEFYRVGSSALVTRGSWGYGSPAHSNSDDHRSGCQQCAPPR